MKDSFCSPSSLSTSSTVSPVKSSDIPSSDSFQFASSSLDNNNNTNNNSNNITTTTTTNNNNNNNNINHSSSSSSFSNPNLNISPLNSTSVNSNHNGLHKITVQEADKLSDQSNLYMPSLYGLKPNSNSPTPSVKLSDRLNGFRMTIIEDAGLRKKQPLFDSAVPYNINFKMIQQKLNKKLYHSINELSLYMFGCYGMPISENNMTTKIHYLPSLPNMNSSVLITRLFSLDSSFKLKPHKLADNSSDWEPHPILNTDELPLYENSSIRFSIGIVIPVSTSINSVRDEITQNWSEITESLLALQNMVVLKLKNIFNSTKCKKSQIQSSPQHNMMLHNFSQNSNGLQNKPNKLNFSLYCLQSDVELYQELAAFLTRIISLLEIPRLFIDLKHSNQSLINWASTLSLWLELKDGRIYTHNDHDSHSSPPSSSHSYFNNQITTDNSPESMKYLASLLSIFLPLRNELFDDDNINENINHKIRVVIGTGNPIVSQKLIFILVGILGYQKFADLYDCFQDSNLSISRKNSIETDKISIPDATPKNDSNITLVQTKSSLLIDIPPNNFESSFKSSPLCMQHSPSVSTISASVQTQRIPVPSLNRTSSYASLQNLSSSYNNTITNSFGSQTSSSSWRNNFGSFMDRWKTSITPSPTASQFSQPLSYSSRTQTPSPNLTEYDEYPWYMNKKSANVLSSSPAPSFVSLNTSSTHQTNRFTLTNNPIINTYLANDNYKINRTTNNLLGKKYQNIVESINSEISLIMNGDFDSNVFNFDKSVLDVELKSNDVKKVDSLTEIPLPMLAGFISKYRPEFNMLSCPNNSSLENILIKSLKNDLKISKLNESNIYFVDLGLRRVNLCQMKSKDKKKMDETNELYVTKSNFKEENNFGLPPSKPDLKKSNLTKSMESGLEYHSYNIFTPYKSALPNTQIPMISSLTQTNVNAIDSILEKIACIINNFFYEINTQNFDSDVIIDKETKCCDSIRDLISELIATSDSQKS
jgi:hypothetical protein